MDDSLVVLGVVVVALFVAFAIYLYKKEKARKAALGTLAAELGFSVTARNDTFVKGFEPFGQPFDMGFDRQARNIMSGTYDGRPALAWDYRYHTWETSTDSNGRTSQDKKSHDLAVVCSTIGHRYPDLSVAPEGFFGRMVGRLTNSDIQFESDAFNRAFTVNSSVRRFASDVLHPRMMEMLLQHTDFSWHIRSDQIITYSTGRLDPKTLRSSFALLDDILDQVPPHVAETDWRSND